jgi:transcriptional regulator of acetoin/glycerol metabolism
VSSLREFLHEARREYLGAVLAQTNGNVREAARMAGIARTTFYKFMGARKPRPMNRGNAAWKSLQH